MPCRYTPSFLGYAVYNTIYIDYYDTLKEKAGKKAREKGKLAAKNFYRMATKTVVENTEHPMAAN